MTILYNVLQIFNVLTTPCLPSGDVFVLTNTPNNWPFIRVALLTRKMGRGLFMTWHDAVFPWIRYTLNDDQGPQIERLP